MHSLENCRASIKRHQKMCYLCALYIRTQPLNILKHFLLCLALPFVPFNTIVYPCRISGLDVSEIKALIAREDEISTHFEKNAKAIVQAVKHSGGNGE
jgi:hypothetical protein